LLKWAELSKYLFATFSEAHCTCHFANLYSNKSTAPYGNTAKLGKDVANKKTIIQNLKILHNYFPFHDII